MKILVNTPHLSRPGGVANHYKGLRDYWQEDVTYNYIGGRNGIPGPIFLVYDYIKFFLLCAFKDYNIIIFNPSLGKTALRRDILFLKIAKLFNIKTVIFFHGWREEMVKKIDKNPIFFFRSFNPSDKFLVLANVFKNDLERWGISKPITTITTKVDDRLLKDFDIKKKEYNHTVLFLSRIENYKGIFTTLKAFNIVKDAFPKANLLVAGDGAELSEAKLFTEEQNIRDVTFLGNISGDKLIHVFQISSIYILPTHGEGMPTSVLEAMAFGLPIISRPVGGLVDFFEEEKMGYLIESLNPEDFADKINNFFYSPEKLKLVGFYNHLYAKRNFMASQVALKIEKIISYEN